MKKIPLILLFMLSLSSCGKKESHTHTIVVDKAVNATCTHTGLTEGSHCSTCGEVLVKQEITEKIDHNPVIDEAVEVTYSQPGLTEGSHCSECGEILVPQTVIPSPNQGHIIFEAGEGGKIVGETDQVFDIGESTSPVTAIAELGYTFKEWSNGSKDRTFSYIPTKDETIKAIFEEDEDPLPIITINTTDGAPVDSKEDWVTCSVTTSSVEAKYSYEDLSGKIKGRGNSTWGMPKKPFKFKLDSKKDLFGFGKAKNWVLLANYDDPSSLRNQIALSSGKALDSIAETTPDSIFVEFVLNGEYLGVYNLTEQVEVNPNRVDITKDSTEPDTGFLVELDWRSPEEGIENTDYFEVSGNYFTVKDPDPDDDLTSEQMSFIKDYFTTTISLLKGYDYNAIKEYVDVDTFAATYIIQEMAKNADVGGLSFYFYKDVGGKLRSGPLWDFDISQGNCDYQEQCVMTNYLYAREKNLFYAHLCKFEEFRQLVGSKLEAVYDSLLTNISGQINFAKSHADSFYRNFDKWQTIGVYVWPNPQSLVDIKTWEGHLEFLENWLKESLLYLKSFYCA